MKDLTSFHAVDLPESAEEFLFSGGVFAVTPCGQIYKHKETKHESKWIKLSASHGQDGRNKVQLFANGSKRLTDIAKTMALVFSDGDKGRSWSVGFIDDNPDNLTLGNLCWQKILGRNGLGEKIKIKTK